jgi:hypothetical protein
VYVDIGELRDARLYVVYATVILIATYCVTLAPGLARSRWRPSVRFLLVVAASAVVYGTACPARRGTRLLAAALLIGVAL